MSTIITRNSATSGSVPSSLVQGELAINVTDGKLFYGSGSGNIVKEFTGSGGGGAAFPYTGSARITGSLNVIGTTTLTGSLNVSGSEILTGYMQFMPVSTNINNSISASYIYVSGSTNDLYFSQNGSGYSNTTRLRWMEGNLYTGLLSGGILSSTPGSTTFNLSSGSGIIVTLNASTSSQDPYPTVQYLNWGNFTNQPLVYSGSARLTYISVNSAGAIDQSPNPVGYTDPTQWDNQIEIGVVLHLSGAVSTGVYNAPQVGYGLAQRTDDFVRAFGPIKISGHTLQPSGSTLGLIKTTGVAYNNGANYVVNPNHPSTVSDPATSVSKIYRYYVSGSTPIIDTGVLNAGYTFIDPSKYNNNGTLTAVPGGQYTIQRVFWIPNSPTNAFLVYYGNAIYNSADTAQAAIPIEPFTEAPNTAQNAILLGYLIVNGTETNLQNALIIQAGLFRSINGVGSSGTTPAINTFAGLADVSVASRTAGDLSYYNGSLWINSKILSGSYGISGSLNVSQGITGSLLGTASYATTALSASFAPSTPAFPYTGSALITGSLGVTGSISTSGSNGTINGLFIGQGNGNIVTNISIGSNIAFSGSATGTNNTAIGSGSLSRLTTGVNNTAIGYRALLSNTTGANNTAFGNSALCSNTTGVFNTAIGCFALRANTSGQHNTAIGQSALQNNTTGRYNLAISRCSLRYNTTGCHNTAIGNLALNQNTTGSHNTAIGLNALACNTSGSNNTAIGYNALNANTTGCYNIAMGNNALFTNTTGCRNTAIGRYTLRNNTTGIQNVAIGYSSLRSNINGYNNVALGYRALDANTSGNYNIAIGKSTLVSNIAGGYNAAIGINALFSNTTGAHNTAIGYNSLQCNTTGAHNTAMGCRNLFRNTTGNNNISIGRFTLCLNSTGSNNIALGYAALRLNCIGQQSNNIAFGYKVNSTITGSQNNIVIGTNIGVAESSANRINIGALIFGSGSFSNTGSAVFSGSANGFVGINQPNPQYNLDVSGSFGLLQSAFINQNTASLASGTRTISTNATGSFNSAFYNYVLFSGSNARAGQVMSVWNGGSIRFTDVATTDIGSTTAVALTASLSGPNVVLSSTLPTSGWTFETVVNLI